MLEYLERVTQARAVEEVWSLLATRMAEYGFDRLIYGYTRYKSDQGYGDLQDVILLSTQSAEYMAGFIGGGLYWHAPMLKWARENVGACSWNWIALHHDELTANQIKVLEFNRKMGATAGYSIAFPEISARAKGAIALTAKVGMSQAEVDALWAVKGREIMVLNQVAHMAITALPQIGVPPRLTARQREALQWVGDGKTMQDIAILMGVTPATVEKHLRKAREALGAETTAQAVLKAKMINQIYVLDA